MLDQTLPLFLFPSLKNWRWMSTMFGNLYVVDPPKSSKGGKVQPETTSVPATTSTSVQVTSDAQVTSVTAPSTQVLETSTVTAVTSTDSLATRNLTLTLPPLPTNFDKEVTDPSPRKVGWVYKLVKSQLQAELASYGLSIEGTVEELRNRLVAVVRANLPRTPQTPGGGTESWIFQTERAHQHRGVEFEADVIREMLGLPHGADTREVIARLRSTQIPRPEERTSAQTLDLGWTKPVNVTQQTLPVWTSAEPLMSTRAEQPTRRTQSVGSEGLRKETDVCGLVRKWNLRFDGERDAISFIERMSELMAAYQLTETEMLRALPELFKDKALLWYRLANDTWRSLNDFKQDFIRQFWPAGYDIKLDDEIRMRTQGPGESFKNYSLALGTLIRRRGNLTEGEKVERIYRNMRPEYKAYVRRSDFVDLAGLQRLANEYEVILMDSKTYQPPPDASRSLVPETAYRYRQHKDNRHYAAAVDVVKQEKKSFRDSAVQTGNNYDKDRTYIGNRYGQDSRRGRPNFAWMTKDEDNNASVDRNEGTDPRQTTWTPRAC